MFSCVRRVRFILGCTVVQCLTSDGVSGYFAIRGYFLDHPHVMMILATCFFDPDHMRVKARQL